MKAIVHTKYGPPDVLQLNEVEKPAPGEDEVLVEAHASSVKYEIPGCNIAGRVEAVGRNVKQFQPGDEVFVDISDCGFGPFAEYVCVPENSIALKPANISFEESAALAQAAVVALQGLCDKGKIQPVQKVFNLWCVRRYRHVCGADCQIVRGRSDWRVQHEESGHGALDRGRPCH